MKKSIMISLFLLDLLVVLLVVAFFVPSIGIGRLLNLGRAHTDEYCAECGVFRKASYATIFVHSFEYDSSLNPEDGLKILHDAFFTPCSNHKWCAYHSVRNSVRHFGNSWPRLKIGFEMFRHLKRQEMKDFISSKPELASQTAAVLFDYAKRGTDSRLLLNLDTALGLVDEKEITLTLASMTAKLAALEQN